MEANEKPEPHPDGPTDIGQLACGSLKEALLECANTNEPYSRYFAQQGKIADIRKRHSQFGVYDLCGHEHQESDPGVFDIAEIGLVCEAGRQYSICFACDTDDGEMREDSHEGHWPCDTRIALDALDAEIARLRTALDQCGKACVEIAGNGLREDDKLRAALAQISSEPEGVPEMNCEIAKRIADAALEPKP